MMNVKLVKQQKVTREKINTQNTKNYFNASFFK